MWKTFCNLINMHKCAGLFITACLFVCLTFNSTLPLNRVSSTTSYEKYPNQSQTYDLIERTKKMASDLERTLRKIKDSTQDIGRNLYDHLNSGIKTVANKDPITEDEIRQYEELVIMKKYPYLDLKDLELKYSPLSSKNTRQSAVIALDRNLQNEPGICDTPDDTLNVEIINRGLSGFAIPPLLAKPKSTPDSKLMNNIVTKTGYGQENIEIPTLWSDPKSVKSLKEDVNAYIRKRNPE